MADTTNYGITKPTVGADDDQWGDKLNTAIDDIDSQMKSNDDAAAAAQSAADASVQDSDIGVTVQAYDAATAKTDEAQTFTAKPTFGAGVDVTGTVTADGLDVDGTIAVKGNNFLESDGTNHYIKTTATGANYLYGGNNIALTANSSGNVGIGTSSPSSALDVIGDIEVSGGVYLGGTGAANKLDDYETGTFTVTNGGGGETGVIGTEVGEYIKVGSLVTVRIAFTVTTNFISNLIGGLPFAPAGAASTSSVLGAFPVFTEGSGVNTFGRLQAPATTIGFYSTTSNDTHTPNTSLVVYRATLTYKTNA